MRVLLVGTGVQPIPPTGYGGVERTLAELQSALQSQGEEVTVLNRVRRGRSTDEYRFALELPRLLRAADFDVVHASTPVIANRLAMSGVPFVYTSHSRHWFSVSGVRERWGLYLEKRAVRRAACTVALTASVRQRIDGTVRRPSRIEVVPIGVDLGSFRADGSRRDGHRALGVGVLRDFKRWEVAAAALRGTGIRLRIAGPIADVAYANRVRAAGDSVELLGEVDEAKLRTLFAESDLLVHPSRVELLAGVVLQGMAASLPVLGASPISDLVENGVTGATAPPGTTDGELARFLREWAVRLRDDTPGRQEMGARGRARAESRFSWSGVARAHIAVYRSVAEAVPIRR